MRYLVQSGTFVSQFLVARFPSLIVPSKQEYDHHIHVGITNASIVTVSHLRIGNRKLPFRVG